MGREGVFRDGQILALAAFRKSRDGALEFDDNPLLAYRWDASALTFTLHGPVAPNFFANDAPRLTPDGHWLMLGKPGGRTTAAFAHRTARGGVRALDDWSYAALPEPDVSHDSFWYERGDGSLVLFEAGGRVPNRHLIRMHSTDAGNTWDPSVRTNFPDADSRLHGLRLSNGCFVLLNNPNPHRYRVPLSLAVSPDGVTFPALANVRIEQTNKRFSGYAKAPGYQYVRAVEHDGRLWVIYSVNKEDIELSVIPLAALEGLLAAPPAYPVTGYGPERVLDNRDREFVSEGPWTTGTAAPGFHGSDYAFQRPPAGQAAHGWAGWDAPVDVTGTYHAYLRWATIGFSQRSEMADIVPVEIVHGRQVERTSVDQTRYGGAWIFLGAYRLAAGDRFQVRVHATDHAITVADALKLVPVSAAAWFPPRAP